MDMFLLVDLRFIDAPIRYHSKVEDLSSSLKIDAEAHVFLKITKATNLIELSPHKYLCN